MDDAYVISAAFKLVDRATAPLKKVGNTGTLVGDNLKKSFDNAEKKLNKLGDAAKKAASKMGAAAGAAATAFMVKGVKDAVEFESALARVETVADTATVPMKNLSKEIMDVSNRLGTGANEIAESAYTAITAGVSTGEAISFVETATKAAQAGFTDVSVAIDGITSVLNGYGLSASEADKIAGQMIMTQNMGKTSFNELADGIKKVIPTARDLGVSYEELLAGVTSLTGTASMKTTDAMSAMQAAFKSVMKPGKEASAVAAKLGIDFSAAALQSKGLAKFLDEVAASGANASDINALFGAETAARAVRTLVGGGRKAFTDAMAGMASGAQVLEDAFAKTDKTIAEQWQDAMNQLKNAGIQLGTSLFPVIQELIVKVSDFVSKIDIDKLSAMFSILGGAVLGVMEVFLKFWPIITAVVLGIGLYKSVMLAAAIITNVFSVANKAMALSESIRIGIMTLLTGGTIAQTAATAASAVAMGTATTAQWLLNAAMNANPVGIVVLVVLGLIGAIGILISMIRELVKGWGSVKQAFKDGGILAAIKQIGALLLSGLLLPIQGLLEILNKIPGVKKLVGPAVEKIKETRDKLKGTDAAAVVETAEKPAKKKSESAFSMVDMKNPFANAEFDMPSVEMEPMDFGASFPSFDSGATTGSTAVAGKSRFHGLTDISGAGTAAVTSSTETVSALTGGGASVSQEDGSAAFLQSISAAVMRMDKTLTEILNVGKTPIEIALPFISSQGAGADDEAYPRNIAPITSGERTAYSIQESRDMLDINVSAEKGSSARITRRPVSPRINLVSSGGLV